MRRPMTRSINGVIIWLEVTMPKKVLVLLAEGFEEVEAITPIDYLRRSGIEVVCASIGNDLSVKGAHGIKISADTSLSSLLKEGGLTASAWDGVVVPGGLPGAKNLAASRETGIFLKEIAERGKLLCAICASPARVLSPLGLLAGKKFTCYPGEEKKIADSFMAGWKQDRVVVDGNLITSRGAGTAGEFACAIIDKLCGEGEGKKLAVAVLLH
jgi:4-methyl-5(b-hydroxyethyl)-thiazole monophosphate biosynthesis